MGRTDNALVEALGRAHEGLLEDLRHLEGAAHPAAAEGLDGLRARLAATRAHLAAHFRFEEQNGYLDAVRKREPRLERAVQQLADEHRQLAESLEGLVREAGAATSLEDPLRQEVRAWIERVRQHEARENDLVQDAFNRDIGTED
jgi:hypothetical protein